MAIEREGVKEAWFAEGLGAPFVSSSLQNTRFSDRALAFSPQVVLLMHANLRAAFRWRLLLGAFALGWRLWVLLVWGSY